MQKTLDKIMRSPNDETYVGFQLTDFVPAIEAGVHTKDWFYF